MTQWVKAKREGHFKVITVYVQQKYLNLIDHLVNGPDPSYPSRSEFLRVAVRNQVARELKLEEAINGLPEITVPEAIPEFIVTEDGFRHYLKPNCGGMHP